MKSNKFSVLTLAAFFILLPMSFLVAQHQHEHSADQKKMMENWMKFATPGKSHKFLAKRAGEWEVVTKVWMQPGTPPSESRGKAHGKMILGGRYLQMHNHGLMMGMPYEGLQVTAYDNHLKKFITFWIDNMGTGTFKAEGTLDAEGKILTEQGLMYDPMTNYNLKMKTITTHSSDGHFKVEMYHTTGDGKEFKTMEMVYTPKN